MADLIPRSAQITSNAVALLHLCAVLLVCLEEHARRDEGPLQSYLPHLSQIADDLQALVQTHVDNEPPYPQR